MSTTMFKPGILVSLKTSMHGGISYIRTDLDASQPNGSVEHVSRWETTRTIDDPTEYEAAVKLRGKVSGLVRTVCAHTAFGMLCGEDRETDLDAAIAEGNRLCAEWNVTSKTVQIHAYALKGRVAATDAEAARAIGSEVRDLLGAMQKGIADVDVKAIREAATRAKQIGAVLDDTQAARVSVAVEAARKAARELVKRIEKEGAERVEVVAGLREEKAAIEMARFSFLDLDTAPVVTGESMPAVDVRRFGELEV
jgi:hypothetical protein